MSIRIRLTLLYTSILGLLILSFSVAVYSSQNFTLSSEITRSIRDVADQVLSASRAVSNEQGQSAVAIPPLDVFRTSNVYTQVWNTEGNLIDHSDNLGAVRQSLDEGALGGTEPVLHDTLIDGVSVRVLTVPIETNDIIIGYLQVASSLEPLEEARRNLLTIMLAGGSVALALSALSGYWLADRALRPIQIITSTAQRITQADDLGRRIPHKGPGDELGRLVSTFNATLARLERLFNAQQRLVADVSHELRTPLTSIRGNLDLIRRMGSDPESMQAIQDEAERMTRLIDDILLLAKADAGRLPLVKDSVELDSLVLEAYAHARVLATEGVEVTVDVDDRASVMGDADRLRQLLLNLVSNAAKHTASGDRIHVALRRAEAAYADGDTNREWAEITVSDTGDGIASADVPRIFDRFYRVDASRTRTDAGGSGLGLSIARSLARAHGGELTVHSAQGRGATFTLRLPLLSEEEEARAANGIKLLRVPQL